ncbi:hypothetical protein BDM02DRAFT_3230153 [Thelephora ganbajun]|uniref:Uncharacterized protein n=1 Tax=Thelephora ganbajun TaxID=370292 RepID=A0ACB6Z064_THEGA|nr:hypothetical protein BDM02DRAFT_3230153 [Thelephora ganbajun]
MSDTDNNISSGALPPLASISATTLPPSISTLHPPAPQRAETMAPSPSNSTSTERDYTKIHTALGSNSLIKTAIQMIPKLAGEENYVLWSSSTVAALHYCKINKILTGKWPKPNVTQNDKASQQNADDWESLNVWIMLHLNLSEQARSQVSHLTTLNDIWLELKKLFKPPPTTSITLHLTSIVNI